MANIFKRLLQRSLQRTLNRKYNQKLIAYNKEQYELIKTKQCKLSRKDRDIVIYNVETYLNGKANRI